MPHRKEMARFCIAGGIITATDFSIYYVLFHFLPFNVAKGISFVSAGIVGYLFSKYWTFKKNKPSFTEILRYASINLLALAANVFVNHYILSRWPKDVFIAFFITTIVTGIFTFVCFKWWVFRHQSIVR